MLRDSLGRFSSTNSPLYKFDSSFIDYFVNDSPSLDFLDSLWGINVKMGDEVTFSSFTKFINLRLKGLSDKKISELINISKSTINKWIYRESLPLLIRLLEYYTSLESVPDGFKWLSINSTRGGLLTGPWIRVPEQIIDEGSISIVLEQIELNEEFYEFANRFGLIEPDSIESRLKLFAFLLGVLVGDASKLGVKRKRRVNRRIGLALTKKYEYNKLFGDFVQLCVFNLGLRMNKIKDTTSNKSAYDLHRWTSQSSMLIQWLFRVCLGLNNDELTSYDEIRMDWLLTMPRYFRIWFLQGFAESDGYVDICTHRAGIVTKPNKNFFVRLFNSLCIKSSCSSLHKGTMDAVLIGIKDAFSLPLFCSLIESYKYDYTKLLAEAKRFSGHWPDWFGEVVDSYIKEGLSTSRIIKLIARRYDIAITQSRIYKRKRSMMK